MSAFSRGDWTESAAGAGAAGAPGTNGADGGGNRLVNANFNINQRASGVLTLSATPQFPCDRWLMLKETAGASATGAITVTHASGIDPNNHLYWNNTFDSAPAAGNKNLIYTFIEGNSIADCNFGDNWAKDMVLSFWVKYPYNGSKFVASLYSVVANKSFVSNFTIAADNTWQKVTIPITKDTTGTWTIGTTALFKFSIDAGCGSTYQTSTYNSWIAGEFYGGIDTGGFVKLVYTVGKLSIAYPDLRIGTVAPAVPDVSDQLNACQRECFIAALNGKSPAIGDILMPVPFPVPMRVTPATITNITAGTLTNANTIVETSNSPFGGRFGFTASAANGSVIDRLTSFSTGW